MTVLGYFFVRVLVSSLKNENALNDQACLSSNIDAKILFQY